MLSLRCFSSRTIVGKPDYNESESFGLWEMKYPYLLFKMI